MNKWQQNGLEFLKEFNRLEKVAKSMLLDSELIMVSMSR